MTFRYSIPDTSNGTGRDASIDVRAGSEVKAVPVTSKYGWYYGGYPFNNNPGDTNPHHFYDEARTMFGTTYPAGTKVRIQVSSTAQSPSFTIDLADFELVGDPIGKPPTRSTWSPTSAPTRTAAPPTPPPKFQAAVDAGKAQGRPVYVPRGNYTLYDHVIVDGVTLAGAGPWYSVLGGRHPTQRNQAVGIYGKYDGQGGPVAERHRQGLRHHRRHPASGWTTTRSTRSAGRCPTPPSTTCGCSTPRSAPGWTGRWTTSPSRTAGSWTRPRTA